MNFRKLFYFIFLFFIVFNYQAKAQDTDIQNLPQKHVRIGNIKKNKVSINENNQDRNLIDGYILTKDFLQQHIENANKIKSNILKIQKRVDQKNLNIDGLDHLKDELKNYANSILREAVIFRPLLTETLFHLSQPDIDPKELPNFLTKNRKDINLFVSSLEEIYNNIYFLISHINNQSYEVFTRSLTRQVPLQEILYPGSLSQITNSFYYFYNYFSHWIHQIVEKKLIYLIFALLLPLLVSTYIGHFLDKFLNRFIKNVYELVRDENENSKDKKKSSSKKMLQAENLASIEDKIHNFSDQPHFTSAFLSVFIPIVPWGIFFVFSYQIMKFFHLLDEKVIPILKNTALEIILVLFFYHLAKTVFMPKKPALQLIPLSKSLSVILIVSITLLASIIGFDKILNIIFTFVNAPESLILLKNVNTIFLTNALIFAIIFIYPADRKKKEGKKRFLSIPNWKILFLFFATIPSILCFLGYINIARYLTQQLIVDGALVFFLYLGFLAARHISAEGALEKSFLGKAIKKRYDTSSSTFNQIGLILGFIVDVVVVLICVPAILMQLGFSEKNIYNTAIDFLTEWKIGNITISPLAIMIGIIAFFVSLFLLRKFISWLDKIVLDRGNIDSGVRNSIKTVLGYLFFAISVLIGLSVAGFNLSSLAIIAGGLSLGVGFGLQNIVQNFVAGLIILIERPFKEGDYIESGSASGTVKRINVRATEIETNKKETIVIPNSGFINSNVSNWTRHSLSGRIDISITVPSKQDPEEIHEILKNAIHPSDEILQRPAPYVTFTNFDNNNFTFTVSVYIKNILKPLPATNNLKYRIYRQLKQRGILS